MQRFSFLGALALLVVAILPGAAKAGVATSGAVLLDPFDPVPEIQFRHYGGYGCSYGCGGCDDGCGTYNRCDRGCYHRRNYGCADRCYRRADCDDACWHRTHCDRDCDDRDGDRGHDGDRAAPCTQGNCYDAEHYERRWRDGDRIGQEWMDRGRKERIIPADAHPHGWGRGGEDWHDDDDGDDAPPPAPPGPPPHH